MSRKVAQAMLAAGAVLAFGMHTAEARNLQVGTCKQARQHFDTIQDAVDAASAGDKVVICPGDYPEQVSISKAITLTNVQSMAQPHITFPSGGAVSNGTEASGLAVAAQIFVAPGTPQNVTVQNVVVDGDGNNIQRCDLDLVGIYYKNAGGKISNTTEQNQILPDGYTGCQSGLGVLVENQTAGTDPITITGNTVQHFDKNGITVKYSGTNANITKNTVTGNGPITYIAQNGIEIARSATATVTSNTVSDLVYQPGTYGSSGIIVYDLEAASYAQPSTFSKNNVTNSQYGIVLDAAEGRSNSAIQISKNSVDGAQFAGIGLYTDGTSDDYVNVASNIVSNTSDYDAIDVCSNHNTISRNQVTNSQGESAIHLDSLCTNTGVDNDVEHNKINTACVGVLSGPPQSSNTILGNQFTAVQHSVVYGSDSYSCTPAHYGRHFMAGHKKGTPGMHVPAALSPLRG